MGISIGVAFILVIYIMMMVSTFYFCVVADPATSPTALFFSHTLPNKVMAYISKIVGPKGTKFIEVVMERLLAIVYLTVVVGGFFTLWAHAYPWTEQSTHVPNYHMTIGYFVFFAALYTWRLVMKTSPGLITPETIQYYDHFPYDDLLYVEGRLDKKKGIPRLPRSKFDRAKHQQHVARFDHYCGWVAATIGEENYRLFLLFVLTQFGMCCYGTYILIKLFRGEIEDKQLFDVTFFDKASGEEYKADKWVVFQYLFHRHIYEAGLLCIMGVMAIALACFLVFHSYITSFGMTTNEHYKWGEVKKWHKAHVKKFKEYQKEQQEGGQVEKAKDPTNNNLQGEQQQQTIVKKDSEETETTEEQPSSSSDDYAPDVVTEDPGPMPKNIYNRGFVQNWKEVLFPISLQRKAEAASRKVAKGKKVKTR